LIANCFFFDLSSELRQHYPSCHILLFGINISHIMFFLWLKYGKIQLHGLQKERLGGWGRGASWIRLRIDHWLSATYPQTQQHILRGCSILIFKKYDVKEKKSIYQWKRFVIMKYSLFIILYNTRTQAKFEFRTNISFDNFDPKCTLYISLSNVKEFLVWSIRLEVSTSRFGLQIFFYTWTSTEEPHKSLKV
jgi:hypothetical protein